MNKSSTKWNKSNNSEKKALQSENKSSTKWEKSNNSEIKALQSEKKSEKTVKKKLYKNPT